MQPLNPDDTTIHQVGQAITSPATSPVNRQLGQAIACDQEILVNIDGTLTPTLVDTLAPYQQAIIRELIALDLAAYRLQTLINSEAFKAYPPVEQDDHHAHYNAMLAYRRALQRRINRFTGMDLFTNQPVVDE